MHSLPPFLTAKAIAPTPSKGAASLLVASEGLSKPKALSKAWSRRGPLDILGCPPMAPPNRPAAYRSLNGKWMKWVF